MKSYSYCTGRKKTLGMDDDDAYDVRAVEARLARMEAARRSRARALGSSQRVVGDFELSTKDASDDETSSGSDDDYDDGRNDKKLRDSLDLSMSMSVAEVQPLGEAPDVGMVKCYGPERNALIHRQTVISNQLDDMPVDNGCAGRLVQRRRELERQCTEGATAQTVAGHSDVRVTPDAVASIHPLQTTRVIAEAAKAQTKIPRVAVPQGSQPLAQVNKNRLASDTKSRAPEAETTKSSRVVPVKATRTECIQNEVATTERMPQETKRSASYAAIGALSTQPPKDIGTSKLVPSSHWPKKSVSFTIAPPPPAAVTKCAYARAGPASQTQIPSASTQKTMEANEPQDNDDDVVSELLTAEEIRLRESLEKLSARLTSLSTSRVATTKPPDPAQTVRDKTKLQRRKGVGRHDANTIEAVETQAVSYGGGAHVKPFQQTSPTTRTSHTKRAELSSGVHKARVRTGGPLVQDAIRPSEPAEGKHKVVIKRDLAHLLF